MRPDRGFCCILTIWLAACATGSVGPLPSAQRIAGLEAAVARQRDNVDARIQLGAAYVEAARHQDAATLLENVVARPQYPPAAAYFLGLAYEGLQRDADARRVYTAYLQGTGGSLQRTVRRRLVALDRRELERAVATALAQESALANTAPEARVVGVFPFLNAAGPALSPLGRALAELLTVDLNQTGRLRIVERAQVQHLVDELRLTQSGAVDPATAARAGRLLGAGRIVQGRLDGTESALRLQAMVVAVPSTQVRPAPITQQGALRQLFAMQNNLALGIYRSLGVELTVAERERVMRQPTQNVQALLAFGMGLEAEDAGRFAEAAGHYQRAANLDPNFAEANGAVGRSELRLEATVDSRESLLSAGMREIGPPLQNIQLLDLRDRFAGLEALVPTLGRRDPASELLGTESLERRALLEILIIRPR